MEEKKRYKYLPDGVCFKLVDTETNEGIISKESVQKLLNQQDKRIKEIEQENKQLKQQLEEYKIYKDWQDILCCKSAQEVIDFVMSNYLTEDEKLRTIADLKQQLHDLPKEIVEDCKMALIKRINIISGYGRMTIDEQSFFFENEYGKDLDTILKKYGDKQ